MKVIVIGGGIGGLTLAHALRGVDIDVRVHERDARPEDTGGYRLHLDSTAADVLARRLPPAVYQALLASAPGPGALRQFGVLDHRMRLLLAEPLDEAGGALLVGRIPLRVLLTEGLQDVVRFGTEFTHAETHHDGTVTAHFANGSTDHGDLLVGADGSHSRVTSALAGRPTSRPLGAGGLAGRTPLTTETRPLLPPALCAGPAFAIGPRGIGMFLSVHDPTAAPAIDPATCCHVPAQIEPAYLLWGVHAHQDRFGEHVEGLDPQALHAVATDLLASWSPDLLALVRAADTNSITYYGLRAADPAADLVPWPAGTITALGDAVHAVPPTGGRGAATAIRDADLLATDLVAARDGTTTIPLAVHAFEQQMARYAPDAIRFSLLPLTWQQRTSGPITFQLARAALPAAHTALRLRRGLAKIGNRT